MCGFFVYLVFSCFVYTQIPIAVIEFEGKGISQDEASALTDRLRSEMFNSGYFTVVERGMMEEILAEQGFQQTGCTSDECIVEIGKLIGVDRMVGGSISKVGALFSVSAKIVSVQTGEIFESVSYDQEGPIESLLSKGMRNVSLLLAGQQISLDSEEESVNGNFFSGKRRIITFVALALWIGWGLLPPA